MEKVDFPRYYNYCETKVIIEKNAFPDVIV